MGKTPEGYQYTGMTIHTEEVMSVGHMMRFSNEDLVVSHRSLWQDVDPKKMAENGQKDQLPTGDAFKQATREAAVLIHQYPQLFSFTPAFPTLYRFFRFSELQGDLKRGGQSLLVGSGVTMPEVAALYVKPPDEETIGNFTEHRLAVGLIDRVRQLQEAYESGADVPAPELLDGQVTAIEPDSRLSSNIDMCAPYFKTSQGKISLKTMFLRDALADPDLGRFNTILLNRADPEYLSAPLTRQQRRQVERDSSKKGNRYTSGNLDMNLLRGLVSRLETQGSLILTVGAGKGQEGLDSRINLLETVSSRLSDIGLLKSQTLPQPLFAGTAKSLFEDVGVGAIGAVIGKKQ